MNNEQKKLKKLEFKKQIFAIIIQNNDNRASSSK